MMACGALIRAEQNEATRRAAVCFEGGKIDRDSFARRRPVNVSAQQEKEGNFRAQIDPSERPQSGDPASPSPPSGSLAQRSFQWRG